MYKQKEKRDEVLDDPKWVRDISVIFCRHFKHTFIVDFIANVPIMIYYF